MLKNDLLEKLYSEGSSDASIVFEHDGKVWVMPEDYVKGGMDMYQPSSRGGVSIKKSIIKKHKAPFYARASKVEKTNVELDRVIRKQLQDLLQINDFYVATYMGELWTSQNNKAVLQIYGDNEIYAYVKVTTDAKNAKRFQDEANALRNLRDLGIEYVPRVIGLDLDGKVKMFAQASDKPMGQEVRLEFNEQILDTAKDIVSKTKKNIDYKDSNFCEHVEFLKTQMDVFDKEQQSIVEKGIEMVESADLTFAFSHGDYTPWNIYYVKDEISTVVILCQHMWMYSIICRRRHCLEKDLQRSV